MNGSDKHALNLLKMIAATCSSTALPSLYFKLAGVYITYIYIICMVKNDLLILSILCSIGYTAVVGVFLGLKVLLALHTVGC